METLRVKGRDQTDRHGWALPANPFCPMVFQQVAFTADCPLVEENFDMTIHLAVQWPGSALLQCRLTL